MRKLLLSLLIGSFLLFSAGVSKVQSHGSSVVKLQTAKVVPGFFADKDKDKKDKDKDKKKSKDSKKESRCSGHDKNCCSSAQKHNCANRPYSECCHKESSNKAPNKTKDN